MGSGCATTVAGGTDTDGFSDTEAVIGRTINRLVEGFDGFLEDWNFGCREGKAREVDAILTIGFSPFSFFFFERNLRLKMLQGFMGLDYVVLMQRLIEWKVVIKRVFKEAWVAWFVGEGQAVYL